MNKILRVVMLLAVMTFAMSAMADQEKKYKELSAEIRQRVWGENHPEFKNYTCPDKYKGQSAVILAARTDIKLSAKGYVRFNWSLSLEKVKKLTKTITEHAMIKIGDEAALKRFSEFETNTMQKTYQNWTYLKETELMVLGVRVIKPDGTVNEVNTDDFVTQSEGKDGKQKTQKLAVPGLQVGDIIEYFIYEEDMVKNRNVPSTTIYYQKDYPVMDYKVRCVIDKDFTTQYRTLNGAPDFTITENEDGDNVLEASVANIDYTLPDIWSNPMAQSPLTLMYFYEKKVSSSSLKSVKKRGIQANPDYNDLLVDDRNYFEYNYGYQAFIGWKKWTDLDLNAVKKMADKSAAARLVANSVYEFSISKGIDDEPLDNYMFVGCVRCALEKLKLPYESVISTSSAKEPVEQLAATGNTTWLLRTADGSFIVNPAYNCMSIGTLPSFLQGRKAAIVKNYKKGERFPLIDLPTSSSADNQRKTVVSASIDGTDVAISRTETRTGTMKETYSLLISEKQVHDGYEKMLGYKQHYVEKLAKKEREGRLQAEQEEVKDQQEAFLSEIEAYHDRAAKTMTKAEIVCTGLEAASPALEYRTDYTMDGLVKRAGKNLMLSVGQLLSSQMAVEGRERERKADVYRNTPSEYVTEITVSLPQGYTVAKESLGKLNQNVTNSCGSFSVKASQSGNTLSVSIHKVYARAFYKAAEWQQLLEIIDAAKAFNAAQVVLKK